MSRPAIQQLRVRRISGGRARSWNFKTMQRRRRRRWIRLEAHAHSHTPSPHFTTPPTFILPPPPPVIVGPSISRAGPFDRGGGRETEGGSYIFLLLFHFRDERRGGEENKKIKHTTFSCHQRRVLVFDFVSTPLPSTHFSARTVGIRFGFPHHETNKNRRYSTTPSVPGKHSSLPGKLVIVAGRRRVTEEILAKRVENRESYTKSAFGSVSEFENNTTKVFTRYRTRLPLKTHRNTALRSPREYECA